MKKICIISFCAAMAVSGATASNHFNSRKGMPVRLNAAVPDQNTIWKPVSETNYIYADGDWLKIGTTLFRYDERGNAVQMDMEEESGELSRVITEYDENNKKIFVLTTVKNGTDWTNSSKRSYVYDPVLTSYCIERLGFDWNQNVWVRNYYCETNAITRNSTGSITEILKSLPVSGGNLIPAYKSEWKYDGQTGNASEFRYYENGITGSFPMWNLYNNVSYRNVVWENTDGQMTGSSMIEFVQGANRVRSCEVYYSDELDGHVFVDYNEDKPLDFYYKETFVDPTVIGLTHRYETLDENGSFRLTYSEYFDEEGEPTTEPYYSTVQEVTRDSYGNIVLESLSEVQNGAAELISMEKTEYAYDPSGNIKESMHSIYDFDTEDFEPESKIVYGEYNDVSSGIGHIENVWSGAYKVYNLQGMPVDGVYTEEDLHKLPSGLYIVNGRKTVIR